MPSPFPGMNPYLEQDDAWHTFHRHFCALCVEILVPQVLPFYFVKLGAHVYIHEPPAGERRFLGRGDVTLGHTRPASSPPASAVQEAPHYGRLPTDIDFEHVSYVEIRDRRSRELVTVVELLSPSNKQPGPDREQYLAKRWQLLRSNVHLVEIDLLRGGPRLPLEDLPDCDYCVMVSQVEQRPKVSLWPIRLRDRLPSIPIPVRAPHPSASLDLQEMLHRLYDVGGYEAYIYSGTPQPPLSPEDAAWAKQFLPVRS
jgi:hypothetical protein